MSTGFPPGVATRNPCNRVASVNSITWKPKYTPGHFLLPAPNGMSWKCRPLMSTSLCVVKNLSGRNSDGWGYMKGSRWSFEILVNRRVPVGTWYPPTVQSSMDSCTKLRGAAGYKRRVSIMIQWIYFNFFKSDISTIFPFPTSLSNSSIAFFKLSGLLRSNARAQVNVPVEVSVAASIKAYKEQ